MLPKKLADITGAAMSDCVPIALQLQEMELEIRPASRENSEYRYRLAPKNEKMILAYFNTLNEIAKYLEELSQSTKETTK